MRDRRYVPRDLYILWPLFRRFLLSLPACLVCPELHVVISPLARTLWPCYLASFAACVPDGGTRPTSPTEPPVVPTEPPVTPTEPPVAPTAPPPVTPTRCSFEFEKCATTADCCNELECGYNGLVDCESLCSPKYMIWGTIAGC